MNKEQAVSYLRFSGFSDEQIKAIEGAFSGWGSCVPVSEKAEGSEDCNSRQAAIDAVISLCDDCNTCYCGSCRINDPVDKDAKKVLEELPSAQAEHLTDKEQRIFLAAMGREEKVCEEVDRNYVREPYEDSLVRVCKEIRRKVKGALWI